MKDKLFRGFLCIACFGIFLLLPNAIKAEAVIENFENKLIGWDVFKHHTVDVHYSLDGSRFKEGKKSLKIDYIFEARKPFIAFLIKDIGPVQDWSAYDSIGLWSYVPEKAIDLIDFSIMAYEEDGSAYIAQGVRNLKTKGWQHSLVSFSNFIFSSGPSSKNKLEPLNLKRVRKIAFGIYQPSVFKDKRYSITIDDVRLLKKDGRDKGFAEKTKSFETSGIQGVSEVVDDFDNGLQNWRKNQSSTITIDYSLDDAVKRDEKKSLKLRYAFKQKKTFLGIS